MVIEKNNLGDRPNDFISCSGSPFMDTFTGDLQKDGSIKLIKTGVRNVYEEIQSYKDSVDINKIVERFQNGEIDILNKVQGIYADLKEAPKSIFDAMEKIQKAKYVFERLPVEVKEKFDNNFENWAANVGEKSWFENMTIDKKAIIKEGEKNE